MKAEKIDNKIHYFGEDYEFTLTEEKFHNYRTLIVKPQHINFINNPNKISKAEIVEEWFYEENEYTRAENNNKKRSKNAN